MIVLILSINRLPGQAASEKWKKRKFMKRKLWIVEASTRSYKEISKYRVQVQDWTKSLSSNQVENSSYLSLLWVVFDLEWQVCFAVVSRWQGFQTRVLEQSYSVISHSSEFGYFAQPAFLNWLCGYNDRLWKWLV